MQVFPRRLSFALGLVTIVALAAYALRPADRLHILTQYYPPYQYTDNLGQIVGTSTEIFRCAMDMMGEPYEITMVWGQGWAAGQAAAAKGEYQAFFGALHTQERDSFASWSISLGDNFPYYIRKHGTTIDRHDIDARWGVKKGSGISALIQGRALNVTYHGEDNPDVVAALLRNEIDWIYMDLNIFRWSAKVNEVKDGVLFEMNPSHLSVDTETFHMEPGPAQPYGVYWTYDFLRTRPPNWMDKFNAAIGSCRQKRELR